MKYAPCASPTNPDVSGGFTLLSFSGFAASCLCVKPQPVSPPYDTTQNPSLSRQTATVKSSVVPHL